MSSSYHQHIIIIYHHIIIISPSHHHHIIIISSSYHHHHIITFLQNGHQKNVFEKSVSTNEFQNLSLKWPILTCSPLSELAHQSIQIMLIWRKTLKKNENFEKYFPDFIIYIKNYADSHGDILFYDLWLIWLHIFYMFSYFWGWRVGRSHSNLSLLFKVRACILPGLVLRLCVCWIVVIRRTSRQFVGRLGCSLPVGCSW